MLWRLILLFVAATATATATTSHTLQEANALTNHVATTRTHTQEHINHALPLRLTGHRCVSFRLSAI